MCSYDCFIIFLMQEWDTTDKLLKSEHAHILSAKQTLEVQLLKVQVNLQDLATLRSKLAAVIQERARVTELLSQAVSFPHGSTSTPRSGRASLSLRKSSSPSHCSSCSSNNSEGGSRPITRSSASSRQKAHSAPVPLELGKGQDIDEISAALEHPDPSFAGMAKRYYILL